MRLAIISLLVFTGCHNRMNVGPPLMRRAAPEVVCIIVEGDDVDKEVAEAAIEVCHDAIEKGKL